MYLQFIFEHKISRMLTLVCTADMAGILFFGVCLIKQILGGEGNILITVGIITLMLIFFIGTFFTVKFVNEKIFWYESMLDSIPYPISVTDNNMKWTFINRPVEQMLNLKRTDVLGKHCSNWGAGICKTKDCGIECLRNNKNTTFFNQAKKDFKVDTNYLFNMNNKKIGHIEVVQDITELIATQNVQAKLIEDVKNLSDSITVFSSESMEKTQENADMAGKAAELAQTIKLNAERGSAQMAKMTQAVSEMSEATQSINKVMNIIDGITSQTSILSLNATVEAAHAGEQGKSFAVVAGEVRNLAAKIAQSSTSISSLIENSVSKAETTTQIANETEKSLNEIVEQTKKSSNLMSEIAKTSEDQRMSISEMTGSITRMAKMLEGY